MAWLDSWPLVLVGLAVFLVLLLGVEAGYRGYRKLKRDGDERDHAPDFLLSAALGLLSLLLGFTFSLSLARYDARRTLVVQEANAISTVWLRSQVLQEPFRDEYRTLLKQYVQVRLRWSEVGDPLSATTDLQGRLWDLTGRMVRAEPLPALEWSMLQAVTDAFDAQASRVQARRARIPGHVVNALFLYSILSMVMLGYILAVKGRRQYVASGLVLVLVTIAWVLIVDLDRPLGGAIVVSQRPLADLQVSMR